MFSPRLAGSIDSAPVHEIKILFRMLRLAAVVLAEEKSTTNCFRFSFLAIAWCKLYTLPLPLISGKFCISVETSIKSVAIEFTLSFPSK